MNGQILNITRYSIHDGPGIRTTVFLKGCPLHCIWCHNPESQKNTFEISFSEKCLFCGKCVDACKYEANTFDKGRHVFRSDLCTNCGLCSQICPIGAIHFYGESRTVESVYDEVMRDQVFYEASGGGVTVSGGEPLMQWRFTAELLSMLHHKGINTAIETSGYGTKEAMEALIQNTDLFLFDIKETDEDEHIRLTGVSRSPILENLKLINQSGKRIILRVPVVPGYQDRKEHFEEVKRIAAGISSCDGIEIMPYHSMGKRKYHELGRPYLCESIIDPMPEEIQSWKDSVRCYAKS